METEPRETDYDDTPYYDEPPWDFDDLEQDDYVEHTREMDDLTFPVMWDVLTLMDGDEEIWSIFRPLGFDCAHGLLLGALSTLILLQEDGTNRTYDYKIHIDTREYSVKDLLNVHEKIFTVYVHDDPNIIEPGYLRVWIRAGRDYRENFDEWIKYESPNMDEFLQGFITMCDASNIDYDQLLFDLPEDQNGTQYEIIRQT